MRHTTMRACAVAPVVAVILALGGALGTPATVRAQTGQQTTRQRVKTSEATYGTCKPSASNNNCKPAGPIKETAPGATSVQCTPSSSNGACQQAASSGGESPDAGCYFNGKCTQANVSPGALTITVEPGFTNMTDLGKFAEPAGSAMAAQPAPYYATLSVTHNDHNSSCEKIYQVVVNTTWNGGTADIAHATVPNGGECNFSNFTFRFQPASIGEVQACPAGGIEKHLHVVLMSHNLMGQLTKDDNSDTFTSIGVVVHCPKLTPSTVAVRPVTYRGGCPAGVAVSGSYDANGNGPMSTVWTFGNGTTIHGSSAAKAGPNTVSLGPTRVGASVSTTVSLRITGAGGTAASPAVPYVVQCLPPITAVTASSSVIQHTGNFCPAQVAFDGTIAVDRAVLGNNILTAQWSGAGNSSYKAPLTYAAGAYHSRLVLSLPDGARGTMRLATLTPANVTSAPATYEVHCNPQPATKAVAAPKGGIPKPATNPVGKRPLPPRRPNIP